MDFAGKIRSGRAYLGWTQEKLADKADLSFQGIQKIERGETQPTARTQAKIMLTFEKNGVRFTSKGIESEEFPIFIISGDTEEDCYLQVLKDVQEHLAERKDRELLISFSDDSVSPPSVNDAYRAMRKAGIKMRQLVQEGNTYLMGSLDEYRYIQKEFFINRVTLVYGDRIASMGGDLRRASVKVDKINADVQRNTFNLLWSLLPQPAKSTAHEKF